jgi:hypothetical protein
MLLLPNKLVDEYAFSTAQALTHLSAAEVMLP